MGVKATIINNTTFILSVGYSQQTLCYFVSTTFHILKHIGGFEPKIDIKCNPKDGFLFMEQLVVGWLFIRIENLQVKIYFLV